MDHHEIVLRRAELYEQVWAEPVLSVARRYGLSDVGLAKICRKLGVPVPGRGYWARKQAGRVSARPRLPRLAEGAATEVRLWRSPGVGPIIDDSVIARVEEEKRGPRIEVPAVLANPHRLIARTAKALGRAKPHEGLVSTDSRGCLNIEVARETVDRALRVADALVKALDARKLRVEVATVASAGEHPDPNSPPATRHPRRPVSRVRVAGEWVEWGLKERCRSEQGPQPEPPRSLSRAERETWLRWNPRRPVLVPSGVLVLEIQSAGLLGTRRTWKDGKHQRIEHCLNDFIAQLFATADAAKRHRAERRREREEREELERRRQEAARRAAVDARNAKEHQDMIERWRSAREVREFHGAVAAILSEAGMEVSFDSRLGELLEWAPGYADRIDPIEELRAEIARAKLQPDERDAPDDNADAG